MLTASTASVGMREKKTIGAPEAHSIDACRVAGLKKRLHFADPIGYSQWEGVFGDEHWAKLAAAMACAKSGGRAFSKLPTALDVHRIAQASNSASFVSWLIDLYALTQAQYASVGFELDGSDGQHDSSTHGVQRLVQWLYGASLICEHIELLRADSLNLGLWQDDSVVPAAMSEAIGEVHIALQDAADFYACMPWEALASFEGLAAARSVLRYVGPMHYFHLDLHIGSVPNLRNTDLSPVPGEGTEQLTTWAESGIGSGVSWGLTNFSSVRDAEELRDRIGRLLSAIDANVEVNSAAATRHSRKSPIPPDIELLRLLLITTRDNVLEVMSAAKSTGKEPSITPAPLSRSRRVSTSLLRTNHFDSISQEQ